MKMAPTKAPTKKPARPTRSRAAKQPAPPKPGARPGAIAQGIFATNAERALRITEEIALWVVRMARKARRRVHASMAAQGSARHRTA
jgi:hypothetical protein